jgi:hypothetical protein
MKLRVWRAEAGTGTASQGAGRRAPMMKTEKGARSGDGEGACHAVVELAVALIGGLVLARNLGKADCVRRPAATAPIASPPINPIRSTIAT